MSKVIEGLTKRQRKELAEAAIKAAKDLGYCSETRNVLAEMGLSGEGSSGTLNLAVQDFVLPLGAELSDCTIYVQVEDGETGDMLYDGYLSGDEVTFQERP